MSIEGVALAQSLLEYTELAQSATSEQALQDEFMQRVKPLGVRYAIAGVIADVRRQLKVTGRGFGKINPVWSEVYYGHALHRADPVLTCALRSETAFYWREAMEAAPVNAAGRRTLGLCAEAGAKDGYLVPMPLFNGDLLIVSMHGDELDRSPLAAAFLRKMAVEYAMEGRRLLDAPGDKYGSQAALTPKQSQALHLAALGRKQKDIARDMGISVNTVEYHLRMVRERTGAHSTNEALRILNSSPANLFRRKKS
jgi:LuxR family quorum-sensing system transcriptional regulator CciR